MPLVRIDLRKGTAADHRQAIGAVVHEALVEVLKAPRDDRFQIISEHDSEALVVDPGYLGIKRSRDCILIQITLNAGRSVEMKKAFYRFVADELAGRLGVRREDVFISLVEVVKENWSFGNGEAQYA